ncbi:MAG: sorbosone dehydrogenase family protein [Microbacteriaceae bacterium]|nr:sorbosone dehydrogenase family protein [Burkholderiaceae bacterium]
MPQTKLVILSALVLLGLAACGGQAMLSVADGTGPKPTLPAPNPPLLPTVNVAPAQGWPAGATPLAAAGTRVAAFAEGLDHPRWLYVLPNGDVLVAESNAPPKPTGTTGFKEWVAGLLMKRAGAAVPSANRITLLRDADGVGVAELRSVLLSGLNSPFGMALVGDRLYVANADAVLVFPYRAGDTTITAPGTKLADLPGGPINHHWTKNLLASADGRKLYVSVGSNSNVAERGLAVEQGRAAIWEIDVASGAQRVFASGLRNPVGMAWVTAGSPAASAPVAGTAVVGTAVAGTTLTDSTLWTVVNERDELGSDLVPDYLTAVKDGGFYGWPYSYFGANVDQRVKPPQPALVASAVVPDYALGPHTASLGLAASAGNGLPVPFVGGMFIGQHGSWNRKPHSGYKVIFVPFRGGQPAGMPIDLLTGFLSDDGRAFGRPVGVAVDRTGSLLVADDVGNAVWRVSAKP